MSSDGSDTADGAAVEQQALHKWRWQPPFECKNSMHGACFLGSWTEISSPQLAFSMSGRRCHVNAALVQPTQAAVSLVNNRGASIRPPMPVPRHPACRCLWQHFLQRAR